MKKKVLFSLVFLFVIGCCLAGALYYTIWGVNVSTDDSNNVFYIQTGSDFETVLGDLVEKKIIQKESTFVLTSKLMKFGTTSIKSGKYSIPDNINNRNLIQKLRSGIQDPVNVTIGNTRNVNKLIGDLSTQFEFDSIDFVKYISDSTSRPDFDNANLISLFIPDTYSMYWNNSPKTVVNRMHKEYDAFWSNNDRTLKAESLNLTNQEVMTLASIVEKETNYNPEKARIAGVYLNRLARNIPLQADPTVVFAVGDFSIRRVLNKHLQYKSPYNTYLNAGLPPGPICLPSKSSIDAVLNYEKHAFIYFCAKTGYGGQHIFAKTLTQHNKNARKYQRWLSSEGIKR